MLRMMYEDGGQDTLPDSYTFSALLRAIANSKQYALLPRVYRSIQRSQVGKYSNKWGVRLRDERAGESWVSER